MQAYEGWRRNLEDLLWENGGLVLLHGALFAVGVLFGALALRGVDGETRAGLFQQMADALKLVRGGQEAPAGVLLQEALVRQAAYLGLFWVLAVSLLGALGVMLIPLLRGFLSGFTVAFLAAQLGGRGVMLAAAAHLPHSLLEVPGLVLGATASVAFSLEVVRGWRRPRRLNAFYDALAGYTGTLLSAGVLLVLAALVEAFVTPALTGLASRLIP